MFACSVKVYKSLFVNIVSRIVSQNKKEKVNNNAYLILNFANMNLSPVSKQHKIGIIQLLRNKKMWSVQPWHDLLKTNNANKSLAHREEKMRCNSFVYSETNDCVIVLANWNKHICSLSTGIVNWDPMIVFL